MRKSKQYTLASSPYLCAAVLALCLQSTSANAQTSRSPVLVELFTSEGCSSCPPADALLAHLLHTQPVSAADIIVLEEHVDYWDQLGWHDRFSSHQFTERQTAYSQRLRLDDIYTPQMIVDGADQFVGNDSNHALLSISQAAKAPKLALAVSALAQDGSHITGSVTFAAPSSAKADLYAVLVEPMASTSVLRGENGGRNLQHVSVVRSMQRLGTLDALAKSPLNFTLNVPKDATGNAFGVIIFAQSPNQGAVLGSVSASLSRSTAQHLAAR